MSLENYDKSKYNDDSILHVEQEFSDIAEEQYQNEIRPLLKILKPDNVSFEEYEQDIFESLFEDVRKIQITQNRLVEAPEHTMQEIKDLLNTRIKVLLEDARDYDKKDHLDDILVRKAKIALIFEHDTSDLAKYSYHDVENWDLSTLKNYLTKNHYDKLSESDAESLMQTCCRDTLIQAEYNEYYSSYGCFKEIPESLFLALLKERKDRSYEYFMIEGILENAIPKKYSNEIFHELLVRGYEKKALEFIDKFKEVDISMIYGCEKLVGDYKETIRKIVSKEIFDTEKMYEIKKELYKRYLALGNFENLDEVIAIVDPWRESMSSEEIQNLVSHGLPIFLSKADFSEVEKVLNHFDISKELLLSNEMKNGAGKCLARSLTSGDNFSGRTVKNIEEIIGIFDLSSNDIKEGILSNLRSIVLSMNDEILVFLSQYISSKEISNAIDRDIEKFTIPQLINLIKNHRHFIEDESRSGNVYDTIFEIFKKKAALVENNSEIKIQSLENIQESFWVRDNRELLPESIKEILQRFEIHYGSTGRNMVSLAIAAYGLEQSEVLERELKNIEMILNKYNPDAIPEGVKVSMGIEYEVTKSITTIYAQDSFLGYVKDIEFVSESAHIGRGRDAEYEIATKPNYNPYVLMAQVRLLQKAGFLDFNFEKYTEAPRGYHLSLVGDSGLELDKDIYFLHNVMTMAQLGGITAGKDVSNTKTIYSKNFESFSDAVQKGRRCEIKGMATDSVEQFEKSLLTTFHAGICIQLCNKYIPQLSMELSINLPDTAIEFEQFLNAQGFLIQSFSSDQERNIVYEWIKLKTDIIDATEQHNTSFIDSEFNGYFLDNNGAYVDTSNHIDVVRNKKLIETIDIKGIGFQDSVYLDPKDLFWGQSTTFVNNLSHINNIFLKSAHQNSNDNATNARAVLDTLKRERYGGIVDGNARESIFDTGGTFRDGYYYFQGASEEMIIHKSQIILNRFNKNMERLLQTVGEKRNIQDQVIANF